MNQSKGEEEDDENDNEVETIEDDETGNQDETGAPTVGQAVTANGDSESVVEISDSSDD